MFPADQSGVFIRRLQNNYLVPSEFQSPEDVRARCESAIAGSLTERLSAAMEGAFHASNPGLWFIRRLDLDFMVNMEIHHAEFAHIWAREIASAIIGALRQDDNSGILHFPDPAAYLSAFLLDLAEDAAWSKWYYTPFDGLRMLPLSAALRTALCDSPEIGLQALRALAEAKCPVVLKRLSAGDSRRVLAALASSAPPAGETGESPCIEALAEETGESPCIEALAEAWPAIRTISEGDEDRRALHLFVHTCRKRHDLAGATLSATAVAAARLARIVSERTRAGEVVDALTRQDAAALYRVLSFEEATILSPLLRCSAESFQDLLRAIAEVTRVDPESRREVRFTSFGGAFLLFPLLDEFPFAEATSGWPDLERTSAGAIIRFLVLAKCFSGTRAPGCFNDSLLRDLMRIPPELGASEVAGWLARLSPRHLDALMAATARWHVSTGAIRDDVVAATLVPRKGAPVGLILDCHRGLWLSAAKAQAHTPAVFGKLRGSVSPALVWCEDSLAPSARQVFPQADVRPLLPADLPPRASFGRDLTFLSLPRELCPSGAADLALSVAAQGILRLFAAKLPGFASSSLRHLYDNFLDCSAALEDAPAQRTVTLGRPSLHLVLGMAGLNRCSYRLSWLDERPCAIYPEASF